MTTPGFAGAGLDTVEGRTFLRERLALLGKVLGLLALAFWGALLALHAALGTLSPAAYLAQRGAQGHLAGALVLGGLWLAARRGDRSLRSLGVLDVASVVGASWAFALMIDGRSSSPYPALLAGILTVVARAVVVPSTARRTFALTVLALLPAVVLSPVFPPATSPPAPAVALIVTSALWIGAATAVATVASGVIYGLRRRAREAAELGAYTLEEKIGCGGMGEVWRARHRMLIRPAAVKLIRPRALGSSPADPEVLLRRFEREARATAALRSPHTVELYDFGVADDGTLYYVMELLEGFNLAELVARFGPQPAGRVVHLLRQVCASLDDAHANGLVHRDVKPANIFVTRLNMAPDFVKVVDFGLVKLDPPGSFGAAGLTAAGAATGTPAFMAPEVPSGAGDARADLYSLGCVAYWLLTGKLVFEGTALSVLIDHARTPPTPPSRRVELPIPANLEALVMRCLEKDPARRPQSAAELATALDALVLDEPWSEARAERWWNAHARTVGERRPAAELLLSQEARRRHTPVHVRPHDPHAA